MQSPCNIFCTRMHSVHLRTKTHHNIIVLRNMIWIMNAPSLGYRDIAIYYSPRLHFDNRILKCTYMYVYSSLVPRPLQAVMQNESLL